MKKALVEQLKRHEGFRSKVYQCSQGFWTIGFGRNIDSKGGKGISESEAEVLLLSDIEDCLYEAEQIFPDFHKLSEKRQVVICNMLFNLGKTRFLTFKKMIKAVKQGDFIRASKEMLDSKWSTQVGDRAFELSNDMKSG